MEIEELSGQFIAGVALLMGSAGSDEKATLCQADGTHSSCRGTHSKTQTYKLLPLWLDVFVSLWKKKKRMNKKSFLQVAPQAFPWGLDETQLKNKE